MPKVYLSNPETQENVLRPLIFDVTRTLFEQTGISSDTRIYFPGDTGKMMQQGSSITKVKGDDTVRFANINQVKIDISEETVLENVLSEAVTRPENAFLFRDDNLATSIRPVYSTKDLTINFSYKTVDKVEAIRWRDEIRTKISMYLDQRVFSVKYHYLIPLEFMVVLKEIYRLRENIDGYGDTWEAYVLNNSTPRLHFLETMGGTQGHWGVAETQGRVLGTYDFTGEPEQGSKEDDSSTWVISFSYKVRYEKPVGCVMFWPLMIHNQFIKYRPAETEQPARNQFDYASYYSLSSQCLAYFEAGSQVKSRRLAEQGIQLPIWDEFVPFQVPKSTQRVYGAAIQLDTTNPKALFNMLELGSHVLDPDVATFLKKEAAYITTPYNSVFVLTLYESVYSMDTTTFTVDSDLNVTLASDPSMRQTYHARFAIVRDLSLLTTAAQDRLRQNGAAAIKIINAINPRLGERGLLPTLINGTYLTKTDLQKATLEINGTTSKVQSSGQMYAMKTVQTLTIKVDRHATGN
jgi:hypothetical protein